MLGVHPEALQPAIETIDWIVFALVVAARFLVPLLIPRYPLPAIIGALALDAADQTIFQLFTTTLPLHNYQSYDKALDVYYLTIAYISTLRNWTNQFAFGLARALFYYRLVGVALFEFTGLRPLLLFFPNTFEYFFIAYEAARLRWNQNRFGSTVWLGVAFAIWVLIKVPQEYWIHIAQRDVTDTIRVLFATAVPGTLQGFIVQYWFSLLMAVGVLAVFGIPYALRRMPPADHAFQLLPASDEPPFTAVQMRAAKNAWSSRIFDRDLLEKTVLVTLLSLIFAQILPNFNIPSWQLGLALVAFVAVNTIVSHILMRRNLAWSTTLLEFAGLFGINSLITYIILRVMQRGVSDLQLYNALFLLLLLTVVIALFDRYEQLHIARFPHAWEHQPAD